jgi:PAS domain S-box-containing protein
MRQLRNTSIAPDELAVMLSDASIDRKMAIDVEMIIIAWNKTCEMVTGIKKEEVIGKHIFDVLPGLMQNPDITEAIQYAMDGKKTFVPSNKNYDATYYYENHFIPLKNKQDEVIGVVNIMHDVAHRIKVEDQLRKLNAAMEKKLEELNRLNNELSTITYVTSNQLKDPLRHVYSSIEQLITKEAQQLSNGSRANLRKLQSSLSRMNLLVDDMLALSQLNSFNKEKLPVDLQQLVNKTIEILYEKVQQKKAVIEVKPLPVVPGYDNMLLQLFLNVVDNALKFQPEDHVPEIKISVEKVSAEELHQHRHLMEENEFIKLCIADNGIGFDEVNKDRIFIMYERLHPKNVYRGSGMGLAISKKIAEAHDGFMTASSSPGNGAEFCCYLPVSIE